MGCDRLTQRRCSSIFTPFSILERIEWAATGGLRQCLLLCCAFQYPRTDRMGCDSSCSDESNCLRTLSVSSNGSNGLRRRHSLTYRSTAGLSVSSNGSNGLRPRRNCSMSLAFALSVSSNGSNGLRHFIAVFYGNNVPLSVSSNGSNGLRPPLDAVKEWVKKRLSVSSNGSNGLRPESYAVYATLRVTFSILERIEWAATGMTGRSRSRSKQLSVSSNGSNGLRPGNEQ